MYLKSSSSGSQWRTNQGTIQGTSESMWESHTIENAAAVRSDHPGTSMTAHWVRLCLPMQGLWVPSLVGELRSHMLCNQKTKTKQKHYCNIFNKDKIKSDHPEQGLANLPVKGQIINIVGFYFFKDPLF